MIYEQKSELPSYVEATTNVDAYTDEGVATVQEVNSFFLNSQN